MQRKILQNGNVGVPHKSKLQKCFNILLMFSSSLWSVYCYAFRRQSRERLLVMDVWLYNEKVIPFFCYNIPVLAALHK